MEFWNAYLAALGGTATALGLLKLLSETLLKQWIKKDEIRLEKKLDALAARNQTKFSYRFVKAADAANALLDSCRELRVKLNELLGTATVVINEGGSKGVDERIRVLSSECSEIHRVTTNMHGGNRRFFTDEFNAPAVAMLKLAESIILLVNPYDFPTDLPLIKRYWNETDSYYEALENSFKEFIGNKR